MTLSGYLMSNSSAALSFVESKNFLKYGMFLCVWVFQFLLESGGCICNVRCRSSVRVQCKTLFHCCSLYEPFIQPSSNNHAGVENMAPK